MWTLHRVPGLTLSPGDHEPLVVFLSSLHSHGFLGIITSGTNPICHDKLSFFPYAGPLHFAVQLGRKGPLGNRPADERSQSQAFLAAWCRSLGFNVDARRSKSSPSFFTSSTLSYCGACTMHASMQELVQQTSSRTRLPSLLVILGAPLPVVLQQVLASSARIQCLQLTHLRRNR